MYRCEVDARISAMAVHPDQNSIFMAMGTGHLGHFDRRAGPKEVSYYPITTKKLACCDINPVDPNYIATSGLNYTVQVWDRRKLSPTVSIASEGEDPDVKGEVWSYHQGRAISACHWDPRGEQLLTTSHDNSLRIWQRPIKGSDDAHVIEHNNFTGHFFYMQEQRESGCSQGERIGRWITNFRAIWSPNTSQSSFLVGNMKRAIDIYSGTTGRPLALKHDEELVTAIPAVNAYHPTYGVDTTDQIMWMSANASGKCLLWGTPEVATL